MSPTTSLWSAFGNVFAVPGDALAHRCAAVSLRALTFLYDNLDPSPRRQRDAGMTSWIISEDSMVLQDTSPLSPSCTCPTLSLDRASSAAHIAPTLYVHVRTTIGHMAVESQATCILATARDHKPHSSVSASTRALLADDGISTACKVRKVSLLQQCTKRGVDILYLLLTLVNYLVQPYMYLRSLLGYTY